MKIRSESAMKKKDCILNILLHDLLRQSLHSSVFWNSQGRFCTWLQVFWPTPHGQTGPAVSGLKGAFYGLPVSAPSTVVQQDLDQGSHLRKVQ